MLEFYRRRVITYHNNTKIKDTDGGTILTDTKPKNQIIIVDWDNLNDVYSKYGTILPFNVWNFKKGRLISFFCDGIFFNKDKRDIKEWKSSKLNITVKIENYKFEPSLEYILKWRNSEQAIQYIAERSMKYDLDKNKEIN